MDRFLFVEKHTYNVYKRRCIFKFKRKKGHIIFCSLSYKRIVVKLFESFHNFSCRIEYLCWHTHFMLQKKIDLPQVNLVKRTMQNWIRNNKLLQDVNDMIKRIA